MYALTRCTKQWLSWSKCNDTKRASVAQWTQTRINWLHRTINYPLENLCMLNKKYTFHFAKAKSSKCKVSVDRRWNITSGWRIRTGPRRCGPRSTIDDRRSSHSRRVSKLKRGSTAAIPWSCAHCAVLDGLSSNFSLPEKVAFTSNVRHMHLKIAWAKAQSYNVHAGCSMLEVVWCLLCRRHDACLLSNDVILTW